MKNQDSSERGDQDQEGLYEENSALATCRSNQPGKWKETVGEQRDILSEGKQMGTRQEGIKEHKLGEMLVGG